MGEFITETIEVAAVFGKNKVKPRWFLRGGAKHDIKEISYMWRSRQGDAVIVHFTVSDGANIFEISFNQKSMSWTLDNVQS